MEEFTEKYYNEAEKQTIETLPEFLNESMKEEYDYGSICCVIVPEALATAYAIGRHESCGITIYEAKWVMWEFIRQWLYLNNITGLK